VNIDSLPLDLFEHFVKTFQEDLPTPAERAAIASLAWQEVCFN